jgi:hypothetical protein
MFADHYLYKADKAQAVSAMTFTLHGFIGDITPQIGLQIYMVRVDPSLTFGCEVALDVHNPSIERLVVIQKQFLRRLLGASPQAMVAPFFTETGVMPIRYRRVLLALRALRLILEMQDDRYVVNAICDSLRLAGNSKPGWVSDLIYVLAHLPVPVVVTARDLGTANGVWAVIGNVEDSWKEWLYNEIHNSTRLRLLHNRLSVVDGVNVFLVDKLQPYLLIPHAGHRKAIYRLLTLAHHLAIEELRHAGRNKPYVPREQRTCRFCLTELEDEEHALFCCSYIPLKLLRDEFDGEMMGILQTNPPGFTKEVARLARTENQTALNRFACYVFEVFAAYGNFSASYLPVL